MIVFRPLYAVGGQDIGYLPGSEAEKMSPWAAAVTDALEAIAGPEVVDEIIHRDLLEIMPLTHIRGRSITDAFIIVDEAQNLERNVLLTALTRIGENSKVVLTHDVAQRDNLASAATTASAPSSIICGPSVVRPHHPDAQRAQPGGLARRRFARRTRLSRIRGRVTQSFMR